MGVWIETKNMEIILIVNVVTPFVGVWIETENRVSRYLPSWVTPFVGVWIETECRNLRYEDIDMSHPSWVCGLKLYGHYGCMCICSHTLRGCVD